MAKVPNTATRVYLGDADLSGVLNSANLGLDQEVPGVNCFSDEGPRRVVGNYDYTASHLGLLEPTSGAIDEILADYLIDEDEIPLSQFFGQVAEGGVSYESVVRLTRQPRSAQSGGAVLLNFDAAGVQGIARCAILGNATVATAGNRTGINQGATTAGQVYVAVFRLLAFDGTNITLTIQESQDDDSGDTYAAISGLTSGSWDEPDFTRVSTSAATEAWKRLAITGTFNSATVLVTGGVVAGT